MEAASPRAGNAAHREVRQLNVHTGRRIALSLSPLRQPEGCEFDIGLGSQTIPQFEFFALLVDALASTGAKMANTREMSLSQASQIAPPTYPTGVSTPFHGETLSLSAVECAFG